MNKFALLAIVVMAGLLSFNGKIVAQEKELTKEKIEEAEKHFRTYGAYPRYYSSHSSFSSYRYWYQYRYSTPTYYYPMPYTYVIPRNVYWYQPMYVPVPAYVPSYYPCCPRTFQPICCCNTWGWKDDCKGAMPTKIVMDTKSEEKTQYHILPPGKTVNTTSSTTITIAPQKIEPTPAPPPRIVPPAPAPITKAPAAITTVTEPVAWCSSKALVVAGAKYVLHSGPEYQPPGGMWPDSMALGSFSEGGRQCYRIGNSIFVKE